MFHKVRKLEKKNKEPRQKSIKRYKKEAYHLKVLRMHALRLLTIFKQL